MLGTYWTVEDIRNLDKKQKGTSNYANDDTVVLPLTLAVNPQIKEWLVKMVGKGVAIAGGDYAPQQGEQIVELGEMSKEAFINWISGKKA